VASAPSASREAGEAVSYGAPAFGARGRRRVSGSECGIITAPRVRGDRLVGIVTATGLLAAFGKYGVDLGPG
jgi:hypothetical protein